MNDHSVQLDQRLRQEAQSLRQMDGFSPLLHERIMSALRRQGLSGSPVHLERGGSAWRTVGITAAAAAVIAVMAFIVFKSAHPDAPNPPPQVVINPPTPQVAAPRLDPASSAIEQRKFAYLDRDANRLFTFVSKQIPTFPTTPQK